MERLVDSFNELGLSARVDARFSPGEWRKKMGSGRVERIATRLSSLGLFPLRSAAESCLTHHDTLVPTTNPFLLPLAMVASRAFHAQAVVPLIYDLYPDALEAAGSIKPDDFVSKLLAKLNSYVFANADGIVFIGQNMAHNAIERYGEPRRWTVIETGADAQEFAPYLAEPLQPESELESWCHSKTRVASYIGNLGVMHDWRTLADALIGWFETDNAEQLGVVIAAFGPGATKLRAACAHLSDTQIRFIEPLGDRAWARLLTLTDISLITLRDAARQTCVPSKTFSAMAAESAILAIAPTDSDLASLVQRHGCGTVVETGDAPRVIEQFARWMASPDELEEARDAASNALREHYDMPKLAAKWSTFLDQCKRSTPSARRAVDASLKRLIDIAASAAGITALAPILGGVALGLGATIGTPVLFRQQRPGKDDKPFELLKFRTMRDPKPGEDGPEHDGARITRLGAFLRATSIDELPTLLNVLRGDMSLVGPRPLLMRYLDRYTPEQRRRHQVKPGITGWAQMNGRNALSWEEKFAHDVWYVDHQSTRLDLQILLATVGKVLKRDGISQDNHATMPEFFARTPNE